MLSFTQWQRASFSRLSMRQKSSYGRKMLHKGASVGRPLLRKKNAITLLYFATQPNSLKRTLLCSLHFITQTKASAMAKGFFQSPFHAAKKLPAVGKCSTKGLPLVALCSAGCCLMLYKSFIKSHSVGACRRLLHSESF